jgi:hypothetical protein
VVFEGKQDLEKQLVKRLRGWQAPETQFVVLRDQDSGDCRVVKSCLVRKCHEAGHREAMVRLACRELESWYLGDLAAVEVAFQIKGLENKSMTAKFRNPDLLANPAEELERVTHGRYQKVAGSRILGSLLEPTVNRSRSFQVLVKGIQQLAEAAIS